MLKTFLDKSLWLYGGEQKKARAVERLPQLSLGEMIVTES